MRDIVSAAYRNKFVILTSFLTAVVVSLLYCFVTPPVYRAETKLLIKPGKAQIPEIEQYRPESYNIVFPEKSRSVKNEIELLKGQYLTERVIVRLKDRIEPLKSGPTPVGQIADATRNGLHRVLSRLGLSASPSGSDEGTTLAFLDALHVDVPQGTDILSVAFDWTDPRFAALAANTYADEYVTQHTVVHETSQYYRFYVDQIALYEKRLKEAEDRLQGFLSGSGIANMALQKELLLRSMADLNDRRNLAAIDSSQIQARISKIRGMVRSRKGWIETGLGGHLLDKRTHLRALDESFSKLRAERERLLGVYGQGTSETKTVDDQIDSLRAQKADSLLDIASVDLSLAQDRESSLLREIAIEKRKLDDINSKTLTLTQLERERQLAEENYRVYRKRAEEERAFAELDTKRISSVTVVVPAIPPLTPTHPKKGQIVLLFALAGLLLGLAFSVVREFFDHTFRNEGHVTRVLDVPLLLSVPLSATGKEETPRPGGTANRGPNGLRRLLGLDFRRPMTGNDEPKSGSPGGVAFLAIIALGLSGYLLFLQKTTATLHEAARTMGTNASRPAAEQTRSLAVIVPAALFEQVRGDEPSEAAGRGSQRSGLTLLCDEFENRLRELEERRLRLEADLSKVAVHSHNRVEISVGPGDR